MHNNTKNTSYLLLSLVTLVAGFFFIRFAYKATIDFPFTQEIVLIILGTLVTIFITALLLNKQTEVEIEKEQNIRHIELKSSTYQQLLDLLEEMSLKDRFTGKEIIRLQFITHKLAVIASPGVISEYYSLLEVIRQISGDNSFLGEMVMLHDSISSLTVEIRKDILGGSQASDYSEADVLSLIKKNSSRSVMGGN